MISVENNRVYFEKVVEFLSAIGIETTAGVVKEEAAFLPGFIIENGRLLFDKDKIKSYGDILHEAAHIAMVPAAERSSLNNKNIGTRKNAQAEEMAAIAWSYAACIYLNIEAHFVFHEDGYKGGGASIVANFEQGNYFGVPILEWLGMTTTKSTVDSKLNYPAMLKWLRD